MDGPINHWWQQDRDRFLVQEGIISNEFKLIIHKAIQMSEPSVWSFPVSLYRYTISSHTFLNKNNSIIKTQTEEKKNIITHAHAYTVVNKSNTAIIIIV